jgi:GntR family transcriptional regulator, transcriptional repressor for pyruvate dehydrogenase complex
MFSREVNYMSNNSEINNLEERIMNLIITRLESGEKLPPEKQLVAELGVSRTALREVLSVFEASGIVVAIQGSGRYVQMPDVSTKITDIWTILLRVKPALLLELLEVRALLEIGSLPKVIERIDHKSIQLMRDLVNQMILKAEHDEDFAKEDQKFHQILFSCTGNILLEQLLKAFWDLYNRSNILKLHAGLAKVAIMHQQMLEAVIRQNNDQCITLMKEQFADARYRILMSLERN